MDSRFSHITGSHSHLRDYYSMEFDYNLVGHFLQIICFHEGIWMQIRFPIQVVTGVLYIFCF